MTYWALNALCIHQQKLSTVKKLEELKEKWDILEREDRRRKPPSYFSSYKADEILHYVTARVSKEAGFNNEVKCINVSESGNAVMKQWQNFEAKDVYFCG